jgi:hypothetical protein
MCDEFFKVSAKKKTLSQALVEGRGGGTVTVGGTSQKLGEASVTHRYKRHRK